MLYFSITGLWYIFQFKIFVFIYIYAWTFDYFSGTLTARGEELQLHVEKAELEKQDWLLEKFKLEEEVTAQRQTISDTVSSKDAEIYAMQKEQSLMKTQMQEEIQCKETCITNLETSLEDLKLDMEDLIKEKDDKIQKLAKELEDERRKVASNAEEFTRMKDSLQVSNVKLEEVTLKYEQSNQRVVKLNLEMSRLINEVEMCNFCDLFMRFSVFNILCCIHKGC